MNELIGKNIHGFRITDILGEGGMGVVYKAYDTKLERNVAIKMLHTRPNQSEQLLHQLRKEAKHQAKLIHPNIVMVHGLLEHFSFLGIVMEYVDGANLHQVIAHKGRLNVNESIKILEQVLLGIDYAHSKGFVHRDIKPSNIILNNEGVAKIMDFGISKSSFDTGSVETPHPHMGTVYYMSPEQVRGHSATPLSDIYSIGCTAYEMLTGFPPFYSKNNYEVMERHLQQPPVSLANIIYGVPEWLDGIIIKALEKNPGFRYHSCGEMFHAIQNRINTHRTTQEQVTYAPLPKRSSVILRFFTWLIIITLLTAVSYFVVKSVEFSNSEVRKPDPNKPQQIERFIE